MGQDAAGIFYGAPIKKELTSEEDEAIEAQWRVLVKRKEVSRELVFHWDGKRFLIGFWVAVLGDTSEHKGAVCLDKAMRLNEIAGLKSAKSAEEDWAHVPELDLTFSLGAPSYWLTTTEIA